MYIVTLMEYPPVIQRQEAVKLSDQLHTETETPTHTIYCRLQNPSNTLFRKYHRLRPVVFNPVVYIRETTTLCQLLGDYGVELEVLLNY